MRLFVAIPMPDECRAVLDGIVERLGPSLASSVRWTRSANWHLTVKFIGEVDEGRVGLVRRTLGAFRFAPFTLEPGGCGFFPNERRPRVAWVGARHGQKALGPVFKRIESMLEPLGVPPDGRPFTAHFTLFRVKRDKHDDWCALRREVGDIKWPAFTVDELVLYQSILGPAGPKYVALERFGG